jgi:DNA adenine methylase
MKESKIKTPITYYGGKQLMLRHILPNIPEHDVYVEPFAGGAAVFFAKDKSKVEFLNDTNRELINFYQVLQNDFPSLDKEVKSTLHSRDLHRQAYVIYENPNMFTNVQRAWALWVLSSQGFSGKISASWGRDLKGNKAAKVIRNKREQFSDMFLERLKDVSLESRDAIKLIQTTDHDEVFFYCDPPYYNSNMGHYDGYTIEDYEMLLNALSQVKGKFLLSSYPSDILTEYTKKHDWHQFEIKKNLNVSRKGKKKIEVLTANYPISNPTL